MKDHEHSHHSSAPEGTGPNHGISKSGGDAHPHPHATAHGHSADEGKPRMLLALFILTALSVAVMAFNQLQITDVQYGMTRYSAAAVAGTVASVTGSAPSSGGSGGNVQAMMARIIPKGIPAIYGSELGVSYDDPVSAMKVMAPMDDGITLTAEQNARYVKIASQISCEYCCGAESIIFPNGQAACGCQHSYTMRGLAKYLLTKHGTEYSDEQVLEELGKWKTLFFPKQILTKALAFESAGKAINTIDLTSNKYRGFSAQAAPQSAATTGGASGVAGLPNMVGGC